ncbi:MAG: glycogen debranching protein GlgX, partial [Deltaproteobacteria bacterium]|nr:glycogen debranching protein GlgX [Deltaproteobacteria bacterium]
MKLEPGRPEPLGAVWDGAGVNFALHSANSNSVELCLFDAGAAGAPETERHPLPGRTGGVWHGYLPGAVPGLLYGYRVSGAWQPEQGRRFDAAKLLVDPRARALSGPLVWDESLTARPDGDAPTPDTAAFVPRAVVVDSAFDWQEDCRPQTPWSRSVLYECHVKGMTQRHPGVPPEQRGLYLGLTHPELLEHLRTLGVTALCLLPIQHAGLDAHLGRRGLVNYWGYGTLGFFAPDARFASGDRGEQVREFKQMVRELHRAGLEVILDVVYNHTPETDPHGATFSLRGIDDAAYYRHNPLQPGEYVDFSGCGNSLDMNSEAALELAIDSLRYWAGEMHVDGFRFDLAPALCRNAEGLFDPEAAFLNRLREDPLLAELKLIAEPWDLGPDGHRLGNFPPPFAEWNDRYRDVIRRYWCGEPGNRPVLAAAFTGSSDIFAPSGRTPQASINFVTCHDGLTLSDVVSYNEKHNESNLEQGTDGRTGEPSFNWGAEGISEEAAILRLRERARRNLVATLALSLGVPMLSHGDELGRTQRGNNNAYCHDSELTWVDWQLDPKQEASCEFVSSCLTLRRANAVFRRPWHLTGARVGPSGLMDVAWLRPDGTAFEAHDWQTPGHGLSILLAAEAAEDEDEYGRAQVARPVLLLLNSGPEDTPFSLPEMPIAGRFVERLDTAGPAGRERDGA